MLKFYNNIVAGVDNAAFYQSAALLFFFFFFVGWIFLVVKRPKNYYKDISNAPLDEDEISTNNTKNTIK